MTRCSSCPVSAAAHCIGEAHPAICARAADPAEAAFRDRLGRRRPATAFPPVMEQAGNLAGAVVRFVAGGLERTAPEERTRRLAICAGCEQFGDGRCKLCGCKLAAKVAMSSEHCPLDPPRW